jgi:hypothetical protein
VYADFWSGDYDMDEPAMLKKVDSARLRGTSDGVGSLTVYAFEDRPGVVPFQIAESFALPAVVSGVLLDTGVYSTLEGHRVSFRITASGTSLLRFEDIEMGYAITRPGRQL